MKTWEQLAQSVSHRTGIIFHPGKSANPNEFEMVPDGLSPGHGFKLCVEKDWRRIRTSFVPDHFAADLIQVMQEADTSQRELFRSLHAAVRVSGGSVHFQVNKRPVAVEEDQEWPNERWKQLELEVTSPFMTFSEESTLNIGAITDWASFAASLVLALLPLEAGDDLLRASMVMEEGAAVVGNTSRYERNPLLRSACISMKGAVCSVCGFDFCKVYGVVGENFIHVHHLAPISCFYGVEHQVNINTDLIPVCPNCHAMLHKKNPPYTPTELQCLMKQNAIK